MTVVADIYKYLETYIYTEMQKPAWSSVKFAFEDQPFIDGEPQLSDSWIRFSISFAPTTRAVEIGAGGKGIRFGNVLMNVFTQKSPTPKKRLGATYADDLEALFRRICVSNVITFLEPATTYIGNTDEWLQHFVSAPFWTDV